MNKVKYNSGDLRDHHAITAIIHDKDGKILMEDHMKYGYWTIPNGKVDEGDSVVDTLKKEIFEECNLVVDKYKEIGIKKDVYERDGKDVEVILHLFEVLEYFGELKNKEVLKHRELKFMSIDEIKKIEYISDCTLYFLEYLGFKRKAYLKD